MIRSIYFLSKCIPVVEFGIGRCLSGLPSGSRDDIEVFGNACPLGVHAIYVLDENGQYRSWDKSSRVSFRSNCHTNTVCEPMKQYKAP